MRTSDHARRKNKLRFESVETTRTVIAAVGTAHLRDHRIQNDRLFDWPDTRLRAVQSLLRVRDDGGIATLTFKGPPSGQPDEGTQKDRDDDHQRDGIADNYRSAWPAHLVCYQKCRQEFEHGGVVLTVDETPLGTFAKLEDNRWASWLSPRPLIDARTTTLTSRTESSFSGSAKRVA